MLKNAKYAQIKPFWHRKCLVNCHIRDIFNLLNMQCLHVLVAQSHICLVFSGRESGRKRRGIKGCTYTKMSGAMPPPLPITPGRPVSYRRYLVGAFEFYQDRYLEELELRMPLAHGEKKHVIKTCKGDERMMAIRKTLNLLGYERSKMQRTFHESFIQAVALHLYKDDPDVDMQRIMSLNNWADLRQSVLCLTPRRFGKSKCNCSLLNRKSTNTNLFYFFQPPPWRCLLQPTPCVCPTVFRVCFPPVVAPLRSYLS